MAPAASAAAMAAAATALAATALAATVPAVVVPAALVPAAPAPVAVVPAARAPAGSPEPGPRRAPYRWRAPARPGRRRPPPASARSRGTWRRFACLQDRRRSGRRGVLAAAGPPDRTGTSRRRNAAA